MYNKINVIRHLETRTCINCGRTWEIWVRKEMTTTRRALFCHECNETLTDWQKKRIKCERDPEFYEDYKRRKRNSIKKHIVHQMWKLAKDRATKYGYEFNLEESDIVIPEVCPILEVPIVLGEKDNYEYTPSLDRIDNSKGYVKGNVQVISKKANSMKNSATKEELIKFCKNVLRYSLNNGENESVELQDKEPVG